MAIRRFVLLSEVDARALEPGSTVELEAGGHVTPLARDTLRARRIAVVPVGGVDPQIPDDLAPVTPAGRVAIGSDHTGVALKASIVNHLRRAAKAVVDCGTEGSDPVDYPDVAGAVARAVARGEVDVGIVIDGAGLGSAIAANKVRGIRAAMCSSVTLARYARAHNGANVLTLGATLVSESEAREIVDVWLTTPIRELRYLRRLLKIQKLEDTF